MNDEFSIVILKELVIPFTIGVYPEERIKARDLVFTIHLHLDTTGAQKSDALDGTYDYAKIEKILIQLSKDREYKLLEKLADTILDSLFADSSARRIEILIEKKNPLGMSSCTAAIHLARNAGF